VLEKPSGPGALLRGRRFIMFLTSPSETGWIGGFADVFRIWIELATSRLVAGVPSGQLNCVARLIAKSSAFPEESKTGPC